MAADEGKPVETKEDGEVTLEKSLDPESSEKHKLEHAWTLWFDNPSSGSKQPSTWGQTLRAVYTFSTVEDFWCLYNNIKPPSWLAPGTDFHLFKEGIEPKWEDPQCEAGGKWTVPVPRGPTAKQVLDMMWLNALLACIGEQFTEGDEICGIVVNMRAKQDKLCLWSKTAANEASQMSLGKQLKSVLDLDNSVRISYTAHADAKTQERRAKDRYTA